MSDQGWSKERPTEPGFYWCKKGPRGLPLFLVLRVTPTSHKCQRVEYAYFGGTNWTRIGSSWIWSGPLKPPEYRSSGKS